MSALLFYSLPKGKYSCWAISSMRILHRDCTWTTCELSTRQLNWCTNGCKVCQQLQKHAYIVNFNLLIDGTDMKTVGSIWNDTADSQEVFLLQMQRHHGVGYKSLYFRNEEVTVYQSNFTADKWQQQPYDVTLMSSQCPHWQVNAIVTVPLCKCSLGNDTIYFHTHLLVIQGYGGFILSQQ